MSTSGSTRAPRALRLPAFIAMLGCTVGALAIVQFGGTDADARTPATCTTVTNALGPATGWSEFVEGNGSRTSDSEGAIAYGGNLGPSSTTVAKNLSAPASRPTMVVAGSHATSYNLQAGSAYVVPKSGVSFNGGGTYLDDNPVDFAAAFTELRALSASWGAVAVTGTATIVDPGSNAVLLLKGTNSDLNVFSIDQSQISAAAGAIRIDVPANSTTIINVTGTAISFGPSTQKIQVGSGTTQLSDATVAPYTGVVWNFPSATTVNITSGGAFGPSVLAPNAVVTVNDAAHTIGQMIAKQFSSQREVHLPLFQSTSCVPGNPPPPGPADLRITKTASTPNPHGGDLVTYTLLVENIGDSAATGVVAKDVLPAGVTFDSADAPCTFAGGTVTCNLGTLAAHTSVTKQIKVVANPVAGAGAPSHPQANHWLTPYKVEQQVDLQPGEQKSVTVSCQPGDILSDGQFRFDHVDQDTGTISDDITVLSSQYNGLGYGSWKGVVRNDAMGRAQAKAFIVCLPKETEPADRQTGYNDSHKHPLSVDPAPVASTATYGAGEHSATVTCPTGTIPIAPGFDAPGGGVVLRGSEYDEDSPRDWVFTLDVAAPTTVTVNARCLRTTVGPVYGHTHDLRFTHVVKTFSVSGHTAKEGDEFQVICPDDAKGVVATWYLPKGLRHFGNDPRLKERAFRIFNDTGQTKNVTLDLLCLRDRTSTEGMGTEDPVVVPNVATVSSTPADANAFNNSSTATITVQPGSATTGVGSSGRLTAGSFALKVASSMPGQGKLTVTSGGTLLAQGTVGLKPGKATTANLKLTWAGKAKLKNLEKVSVRVVPTRGKATSRTVRVLR